MIMNTKNVFINLSNHPSGGWGEEQLKVARRYGTIADFPFPPVEPNATLKDVNRLARECVTHILEMGHPGTLTVHVMGEMTLTYHIVRRLKRRGVRCMASTTKRIATEVDGKKITEFHFVQFREY